MIGDEVEGEGCDVVTRSLRNNKVTVSDLKPTHMYHLTRNINNRTCPKDRSLMSAKTSIPTYDNTSIRIQLHLHLHTITINTRIRLHQY